SGNAERTSTAAVRMSFSTDEPFFPYREPKVLKPPMQERLLRVALVSASPVEAGNIRPAASRHLDAQARAKMLPLARLPVSSAPDAKLLTVFEDRTYVRRDADVYFRPPSLFSPLVWVLGILLLAVGFTFLIRRR